ncbi:MAG: hypothetical protein ACLU3I_05660 [Acutalibacteraceae bacterium]
MPAYDLRYIQAAKYTKSDSGNTVTYSDVTKVGDAMTANFELRNAEVRLYAESSLAEYMRKATGGTISLGVKYITEAAQVLLYKAVKTTRSVKTKSISVVRYGKTSTSQYVGVSFYAPDMIDGVEKFTCSFHRPCALRTAQPCLPDSRREHHVQYAGHVGRIPRRCSRQPC